ncbi:ABC transporter permease [Methylomonas sp. HW2-6]|uniref:ABC transporter permease n=1 Tax=Methylomonas sp. HW2-6 TaxID=3376687 RepID=UPI00404296ED
MKHFLALLTARNIELIRDKATWVWNFVFPVVLIVGIAAIFDDKDTALFKVGVVGEASAQISAFKATQYLQFIDYPELDKALAKLQHHQLDMVIRGGSESGYWINDSAAQGYLLEKILLAGDQAITWKKQVVSGRQVRYLDWVLPGILAINIMHSSLFGVGFTIVRYRKNGVLKRLKASPVNAFEFLSAQVVSRLAMLMLAIVLQFVAMHALFDFLVQGAFALLALIAVLGSVTLISLGLLMASRTSSEELALGILNLLTLPMILLSGVWFSLEGAPALLQNLTLIFPLTHMLQAARAVMIDGAGLSDIAPALLTLSAMTLLFLTSAALRFRWVEE